MNKGRIIPFVIIGIGLLILSRPVYFYGKGILAESLLNNAWAETKRTHKIEKPWRWADFHPIGRISIPSISLSSVVVDNISVEALAFGPGHLSNSATIGEGGNIVIAGHRDSYFRSLKDIKLGDLIQLESKYNIQYYEVKETVPTHASDIYWVENTDYNCLTLVTCYPFNYIGEADERFIVRAELID